MAGACQAARVLRITPGRVWARSLLVIGLLTGLGFSAAAVTATPTAASTVPYATVSVAGASLANLEVASPYALSPAFSPVTTDSTCGVRPDPISSPSC
jgi:hypothetical protein